MNKVILIGRLARDPEMRTTGSGIAVTRFTIAVSRPFNPQNGQQGTDFIGCVAWRRQAENIAKYCSKGSQVAVEGRIQTGSYDGADGQNITQRILLLIMLPFWAVAVQVKVIQQWQLMLVALLNQCQVMKNRKVCQQLM